MRRKGERRLQPPAWRWSADMPIARAIADGDHWMDAWIGQCCTPLAKLSKVSGLPEERLHAIRYQGDPTADELAALAMAWHTTPADLAASIAATAARSPDAPPDFCPS